MAAGMLKNWRRIFVWRKKSFSGHQGHLHIGITEDARRQQAGRKLVSTLTDHAALRGVGQLEASVHEANKAACIFFETQGFVVRERYSLIMTREGKDEHSHSLLYVKTIKTN